MHSYIYPNLLKLKFMSIVDRPSDRPQLERHCYGQQMRLCVSTDPLDILCVTPPYLASYLRDTGTRRLS